MAPFQATIVHHPGLSTLRFPVLDPKDIYNHVRRPTSFHPQPTHAILTVTTSTPDHAIVLSDSYPFHSR